MIKIVNVSPIDAPLVGLNDYELRINDRVMTTFEHERQTRGLAACLRDAADAMEKKDAEDEARFRDDIIKQLAGFATNGLPATPTKSQVTKAKKESERPPAKPSEVLYEFFDKHDVSIDEAAKKLGRVQTMFLAELKAESISVDTAVRLEKVYKINASRLLMIEAQYKEYRLQRALADAEVETRDY